MEHFSSFFSLLRPNGGQGKLQILALLPPVDGAWELVTIDPSSGSIATLSAADKGIPSTHVLISGASYVVPAAALGSLHGQDAGAATAGDVLYIALANELGEPPSMYGIDLDCALKLEGLAGATNCTVSTLPWPLQPGQKAPMDLGLYLPPTVVVV